MDVECYFGIVLFSSDFLPIGILAVMDDKPLEDPKFAESIHRILASRAPAELDRLRFEALLKAEQDHVQEELDSTSDPLFIIDSYGVIRNISGPVQRIFGWEPSELIGKNISMLAPEPHRTQHHEYLAKYRKTGKTKIIGMTRTFNAERKNGELIPIELTVWPLDSQCQGELLFAGLMRDKSVRKAKTRGEILLPARQSELKPV